MDKVKLSPTFVKQKTLVEADSFNQGLVFAAGVATYTCEIKSYLTPRNHTQDEQRL